MSELEIIKALESGGPVLYMVFAYILLVVFTKASGGEVRLNFSFCISKSGNCEPIPEPDEATPDDAPALVAEGA